MLVKDQAKRLGRFPPASSLRAVVMDGANRHVLRIMGAGHHNPPPDLAADGSVSVSVETEGVMLQQTEFHPVELFTEPWPGGIVGPNVTVGEITALLESTAHHSNALIRVAVPVAGNYHRCLDIDLIGFGAENDAAGEPVVEITTERWDSMAPVIRQDAKE